MTKENQILVRVNDPMNDAVEEFAEDRDYNKAEASRKILESRLKGEGYLRRQYGDNDLEPVPDGGQIVEQLDKIEEEVKKERSSVEELKERAEEDDLAVAESPLNGVSSTELLILSLTLIITLRVFGFI